MANINFSAIFDQLKTGVTDLAKSTVSNYLSDAKKDGLSLLNGMKDDLKRWINALANGDLTIKEFEFLVNAEKDSLKMAALEKAGLALIRVDQFKSSLLNLIVDTVLKAV